MNLFQSLLRRRLGGHPGGAAMDIPSANQLSPDMPLKSIIQKAKLSPAEKVKAALKLLRGETVAEMCNHLGRGPQHVSVVLNGKRESETLKREIAAYLGGLAVEDIFPPQHAGIIPDAASADQREA